MKISELNIRQGNVEVEGVITEKGEVRTLNKYGRDLKVANAILEDDSGKIKLTLWNDDTRFKDGDKVRIVNGYVGEFQGEKQLTSGKFGKIEMIESSRGSDTDSGVNDTEEIVGEDEEEAEESEESEEVF